MTAGESSTSNAPTTATGPMIQNILSSATPSPVKVVRVNVGSTVTSSTTSNGAALESMQRSVVNAFALKYSKPCSQSLTETKIS